MNDIVTLLNAIIQAINTLLLNNTDPAVDAKLWKLRNVFTALRDTAMGKIYDKTTGDYVAAQKGLTTAAKAANDAIDGVNAVATAMQPLITAAQAADKVIGLLNLVL